MSDNIKLLYAEILKGYSCFLLNGIRYYIKHLNHLDVADIDIYKNNAIEYAVSKKIPKEKEKLDTLIHEKQWTIEKEKEIEEFNNFIASLYHTKKQYVLEKDKKLVDKEISIYKNKLYDLQIEKNKLIGKTAEQYADKKVNEYYIYLSLFKDDNLKERIFSLETFEELELDDLNLLSKYYNQKISLFNDNVFKKIALMPFFMNIFLLSDKNPYSFFGKPIVYLTFYQMNIFQHAKNFNDILSNSKIQPPPEIFNDPDKLFEWFENSKNMENLIDQRPIDESNHEVMGGSSVVGAKKEDYKKYGIDSEENKALMDKLKSKGELNVFDLMNT